MNLQHTKSNPYPSERAQVLLLLPEHCEANRVTFANLDPHLLTLHANAHTALLDGILAQAAAYGYRHAGLNE